MIDPTRVVSKAEVEPVAPVIPRPEQAREREREAVASSPPEVKTAEKQKQVPPNDPVLDVHLDGETMRLYTELRDPQTDRVLLRLPAAYKDEKEARSTPETSIKA